MFRTLLTASLLLGIPGMARAAGAPAHDANATLDQLCTDYWNAHLRFNPEEATSIGDKRFDAQLDDNTPAGIARERAALAHTLAAARAIAPAGLDAAHRLDRSALIETVGDAIASIDCHRELWNVDPRNGPQSDFMNVPDFTTIATLQDGRHYVARVRAMGPYVDQVIANLKRGLAQNKTADRRAVESTLDQLDHELAEAPATWPLAEPGRAAHADWGAEDRARFTHDLDDAVTTHVRPAFERLRVFLKTQVLPAARSDAHPGLSSLPGGLEDYRRLIHIHTSLDRTPAELHQLGLDEVKRNRAALAELGQKVLGTRDIAEIQRKLRDDPAMHFATAQQIEDKARATLARAKAAIPQYFHLLPKADCQVKVMGMHEAPYSTIAYYRQGSDDGSRPANYMINTYQPTTRPRYEAEALAFHESIPGHHLQLAIAAELTGLPEFRRHEGVTAFVEGWGLYSERLADDMGLYSGDIDRIGMLSYDAWRACRLVVDTGLHAMGWSRQQAIDYMVANTVLAPNNIENEVDRYITDPGQALAYKVGQLEILKLRAEAKDKLGARFDILQFHDAVLKNGAVALPVLREQVEAWIAEAQKGASR